MLKRCVLQWVRSTSRGHSHNVGLDSTTNAPTLVLYPIHSSLPYVVLYGFHDGMIVNVKMQIKMQ
jgi:hypothetical protein